MMTTNPALDSKMIKLPKLDIPTFDSNILHWLTFRSNTASLYTIELISLPSAEVGLYAAVTERWICKERHQKLVLLW